MNHAENEKKARILIVDDVEYNIQILTSILENEGYENIESVNNGNKALSSCKKNRPDLILMDFRMPGMNGVETTQALKSNPTTQDIPIILITANVSDESMLEGFKAGAIDFIAKPFNPEILLSRVKTNLTIQNQNLYIKQHKKQCKLNAFLQYIVYKVLYNDISAPAEYLNTSISSDDVNKLDDKMNVTPQNIVENIVEILKLQKKQFFYSISNMLNWMQTSHNPFDVPQKTSNIQINSLLNEIADHVQWDLKNKEIDFRVQPLNDTDGLDKIYVSFDYRVLYFLLRCLLMQRISDMSNKSVFTIFTTVEYNTENVEVLQIHIQDTGKRISEVDLSCLDDVMELDLESINLGVSISIEKQDLCICKYIFEMFAGTLSLRLDNPDYNHIYISLPMQHL